MVTNDGYGRVADRCEVVVEEITRDFVKDLFGFRSGEQRKQARGIEELGFGAYGNRGVGRTGSAGVVLGTAANGDGFESARRCCQRS